MSFVELARIHFSHDCHDKSGHYCLKFLIFKVVEAMVQQVKSEDICCGWSGIYRK